MNLQEALKHFFKSDVYKEKAKQRNSEGSALRNNEFRWREKRLGEQSALNMLSKYDYKITKAELHIEPPDQPPTPPKKKNK